MSRVSLVFDDRTIALLDQLERTTGASRSEIVRRAVARYAEQAQDVLKQQGASLIEAWTQPIRAKLRRARQPSRGWKKTAAARRSRK